MTRRRFVAGVAGIIVSAEAPAILIGARGGEPGGPNQPYAIKSDGLAFCKIPVRHSGQYIDVCLKYRLTAGYTFPSASAHWFGGHGSLTGGYCVIHHNTKTSLGPWCFGGNGGFSNVGLSVSVEHEIRMVSESQDQLGRLYIDGSIKPLTRVASRTSNDSWMLLFAANENGKTSQVSPHFPPAAYLEVVEFDYSDLAGYSARFRPYVGGDGKAGFVDIDSGTFMGAYGDGSLVPVYL